MSSTVTTPEPVPPAKCQSTITQWTTGGSGGSHAGRSIRQKTVEARIVDFFVYNMLALQVMKFTFLYIYGDN